MRIFIYMVLFYSVSTFANRKEICPEITPVMISPILDVKVIFDKKNLNYIYRYKVTNFFTAKSSIWRFSVESFSNPVSIKSGKGWETDGYRSENKEIQWNYEHLPDRVDYRIKPGQVVEDFEIISKQAPGLIKVYFQGDSDIPSIKFDSDEESRKGDHETIVCPGFYRDSEIFGDQVTSIIAGPSVPNRLEAKIRLKKLKEKKWAGSHNEEPSLEISPLDSEKIQLMVFGDKDIDVSKINLASLEFGRGKAKPTKTEIIGEFKGAADAEIVEHVNKTKNSHLLLEFNLQDVDVKCDIDRALFLTGKIGTQDLFGAAKIKHVGCNKETFSKEAKKIRESKYSH